MAYGLWQDEAGNLWLMACGTGQKKRATDGITFRSDLVLQAIGYKLISPSITCYTPSAIRSFPNEIRFTSNE